DCDVTYEDIQQRFGTEVGRLVDGVTKLSRMDLMTSEGGLRYGYEEGQAESLRKMLVAMAEDIRVVLIKLADRLHNMQTLKAHSPEKRIAIARETLDIYAPLAHRLGIWDIKWRLEDLAFSYLQPAKYREISRLLTTKQAEREKYLEQVCQVLREELDKTGIKAEVTGRPKHIYSIFQKIEKYAQQGKEFGQIYDLFALRILVPEIRDCYSGLGVIHGLFHPIRGEFDDYIATPKDNMYQSLHTAVMHQGNMPLEIQVRTYAMHQVSEYGVAAHWRYKEGDTKDPRFEEKMSWLRQLLDWQREVVGAEEFLESVKTDLFQDQVFVYTPKGDVRELPSGSTPIDFAYRIHTDLGHRCIGGKVNGKLVPLYTQVKNGDTVEVLTSKVARGPSLDWLNINLGYANTANAREKIRQWFRKQERSVNIQRGKELLTKELRRLNMKVEEGEVAALFKFETAAELLASLGNGTVSISQVTTRLAAQQEQSRMEPAVAPILTWPSSGIEVLGVGDLLTRVSQCCNPIPGDEIVGYITRNRGVSVHSAGCHNIRNEDEKERLVQVDWSKSQTLYPIRIRIEAWDRVGLLRDVTTLVSQEKVNIASLITNEHEDSSCSTYLTMYTTGVGQLSRLFSRLEGVGGVFSVTRSTPKEESQIQPNSRTSS
ncbi:MAG: bifunctional (p)ppGpp synthetase/guanosine-3',5'-bis(diphosphate) 3'-pyrophosphohydrolase, partial [Dehalococcoidia bacterium]|nr:bifunctional (p)ppGpp synthetase/guanosine-3',5'-bis(diphosphate) 3'-pyrophosphohydrolase [Dehalococcoidia bacterium]